MSKIKKRFFWASIAVFAVGLCAALPLMVYLILYSIDPVTHFYYDNAKLVPVLNWLLIALTVFLLIPMFFKRGDSPDCFKKSKQTTVSIFSALLAISLCVSSAYDMAHAVKDAADGGADAFFMSISGILAAIFFFAFAVIKFRGKKVDLRLLALLPVIWGVVELVSTFMSMTQIANISEYLYVVLEMVFAILFLYYHARLVAGVTNSREVNGVFAFGLPCAFYGIASTLPNYIAHAIEKTRGRLPEAPDAVLIVMSIYIVVILITLLVQKPGVQQEVIEPIEPVEKQG